MKLLSYILAITLLLCPAVIAQDKVPQEPQKVIKMSDIKQGLAGFDKEYNAGELIKIKVSPLPSSSNTITSIYKFTLLENGKASNNCEILTKSEKNTEAKREGSDFIFTAKCGGKIKYQVIFGVTYIETKPGTSEILNVYNPDIVIYDVKINGSQPDNPDVDPTIPDGNYGMIKVVYNECQKMQLDKAQKIKLFTNLANSFSGMSSKIAAGVYKDSNSEDEQADNINKFLTESKDLNNKSIDDSGVDRSKFDGTFDVSIKNKLTELFNSGKLRKFSEYQAVWAEIAEGYRIAIKGL